MPGHSGCGVAASTDGGGVAATVAKANAAVSAALPKSFFCGVAAGTDGGGGAAAAARAGGAACSAGFASVNSVDDTEVANMESRVLRADLVGITE